MVDKGYEVGSMDILINENIHIILSVLGITQIFMKAALVKELRKL